MPALLVRDQDYDVVVSHDTVWVNDAVGMCIGRFGPRGVDVHANAQDQLEGAHCLACCKRTANPHGDWGFFVNNMLNHHRIQLTDQDRPERI
ncbi:hypothetical protein CcrC1_gp299 [Caulobacter phage C1]|nr:hypothetical protein CcrC1_gp299 [Caulobacter phage C1]UTU08528.1 hypothetical protein CcrC2_gp300 [Caulobacter phage C2]UTU09044.1 hypothetical protein CcrJ4_gp295 [Caulobacter phage J4]UTU09604.1 hypothetical protein CcrBL47_gp318 [Caulobacter phage BL47]UTU10161.1 hypothetical protein CcrRB23_gp299 [Caulobacter phage RB23]WGN97195.1 hypothetical protein [Bertelyvirus sp.]